MKKILFPFVMILTLACTVGIYYILFDQQTTTLFYINTVVACVSEVLLLINVPMWSGRRLLTITNASVSILVEWYAVLTFVWSTIFTLAIYNPENEQFKTFYVGVLLLTLLFVVLCGVSAIGAHTAEKTAKEQVAPMEYKQRLMQRVYVLGNDITNLMSQCGDMEWMEECEQLLRLATDKIGAVPHEKLQRNKEVADRFEKSLGEIVEECQQLSGSEIQMQLKADIIAKLNRLIQYVKTII